jgi:Methyltransferase FkbM domain
MGFTLAGTARAHNAPLPAALRAVERIPMARQDLDQILRARGLTLARASDPRRVRALIGRMRPLTTEHELVRIGGLGDGGYLVPGDLAGVDACFSPGVSTVSTFEQELADRGIPCFLADHSVDGPAIQHPQFHFQKKFLGADAGPGRLRLSDWVRECAPGMREGLLQMDIEGSEFEVILDTDMSIWARFRILVIEFHHLQTLQERMGFALIDMALRKLLRVFEVVHLHPNNSAPPAEIAGLQIPSVLEISFLRRDRIHRRDWTVSFPHALDRPNIPDRPDYPLPACWYTPT